MNISFTLHSNQAEVYNHKARYKVVVAGRRFGKALALDTPILTSGGWRDVGSLKEGDYVFDESGTPVLVDYLSPIYENRDCYRVLFSDGSELVADGGHDWVVETKDTRKRKGPPKKVTTEEMAKAVYVNRPDGKKQHNYSIPVAAPIKYPEKEFQIDPYILGTWLGDGSSTQPMISTADPEILEEYKNAGYTIDRKTDNYTYVIKTDTKWTSGRYKGQHQTMQVELKESNVLGNKHIPRIYLEGSQKQRLDLLQGLMDTDGTVSIKGHCEFSNCNKRLAEDTFELITSLGIKATIATGEAKLYGRVIGPKYRVCFSTDKPIFRLPRKLRRLKKGYKPDVHRRYIVGIDKVDSVPVKCIHVKNESHLFLAGKGLIATHNTHLAVVCLLTEALSQADAYLWYVAPTFRQAKMIAWRLLRKLAKDVPCVFNEAELSVKFPNGSIVELKGADNEDSLRGVGLGSSKGRLGLVVDEYATIYDNYEVWNSVLRPMLTDRKAGAIFIGTPRGKDSFYELWLRGMRYRETNWKSWRFRTTDNLALDLADEVEEAKLELPERLFNQEYMASFEDFEGKIYPEFREKLHVRRPFYIPTTYTRLASIDPAISGTTAVLKAAIDEDGRVIVYEEFYEQDVRVDYVCKKVFDERIGTWFIDPASRANNVQKEGKSYSLYDMYQENGIAPLLGENDVEGGINKVGEYFKQDKIIIFSTCTNLINELERYHWAQRKETDAGVMKPKPYKKDDHTCDALRYLIMSRPMPSDITDLDKINPNSAYGRLVRKQKKPKEHIYSR